MSFLKKNNLWCSIGIHQREWTTAGGSGCWQSRRCKVCGIIEQRERHSWFHHGEWTTADGSGCWQSRRCKVCGIIEQRYISFVFSDAVYLFGTTFSSAPSWLDFKEELPDGTKVSQSTLAEQVILAAFAYLYKKQLIDIVLEEGNFLFIKKKTIKVKKLQSSAPYTRGLEAVIFTSFLDKSGMYGITFGIIPNQGRGLFSNPWRDVLQIVKENLLQRGILKQVVKGTTYKYVVNGDISKEAKQVIELKKTLTELQSKGELYERMLSAIAKGIAATRMDTGPD